MAAFAKLVGRVGINSDDEASKREYLIRILPCCLGRALSKEGGSIVVDANDTLLSRQHVQIAWSLSSGWKLICLSKNGCTVNKKRYEKDGTAPLFNGSAIRIGNARLYFTLPVIDEVSVPSSKKRDRAGNAVTDGDDDDDDDIHGGGEMPFTLTGEEKTAKSVIKLVNGHSPVGRLKANGERSQGTGINVTMSSSVSGEKHTERDKQAPIKGDSYLAMIDSAFQCGLLLRFGDDSIHQTELVNWVSATYVETLGEIQRQSVCKGVYNALIKNFEKVENEEDVGKPQKRGSIRWRRLRDRDSDGPMANIASDDGDVIAVDKTFVGLP